MDNIAERYAHLGRSYILLADKFQKLDVEHMTLKKKVIPFLELLKTYKQTIEVLQQENKDLTEELAQTSDKYESLKSLELLLQPDVQATLAEAETLIALVNDTIQEMQQDSDPDLSTSDKLLLDEYKMLDKQSELVAVEAM